MKIDCVPAEQVVRKPENTIIVQQALNFLIMATVQDQENEHTEDSTTVLVEMRSRQCDDGAWGTSWVQQPESDKVSGPNAHKTAGRIGAWKPSYLQAQPGSTCRREEHVESGSATFCVA